jgi:hypothetical protein
MAAQAPLGPAAAMPLVPAPAPVAKLSDYYADDSNDPTGGDPSSLLTPFEHDLHNNANNVSTNDVKAGLAQSGENNHMIAVAITSGGKMRLLVNVFKWTNTLLTQQPDLAGKYFALDGELIGNQGTLVELPESLFNLPNNAVAVPDVQTITTAIAGDAALERMGPYAGGDPNTEGVKTRKLVPVPHFICQAWLALGDEGITPRQFFTAMYPLIVNEGKEAECKALIQYAQVAITIPHNNAAGSAIDVARLTPPPRNIHLIQRLQRILQDTFPQLRPDAAVASNNLIAQGIGVLATQQQAFNAEQRREREAAKADPVRRCWGEVAFKSLLRNTQQPDEAALVRDNPVYLALAQAKDKQKVATAQSHIQEVLDDLKEPFLTILFTQGHYNALLNNQMGRSNADSLTSGFLGNSFLFGMTDVEQMQTLLNMATLHQGGETAMSEDMMKRLLQVKVNLPLADKAFLNVQRQMIVCKVFLPPHHTFRIYIEEHYKLMTAFKSKWDDTVTPNPAHNRGKGVLYLQWLNLRADGFWIKQSQSDAPVQMPSTSELIDLVTYQTDWEPKLSPTLRNALNWDAFCQTGVGRLESKMDGSGDVTYVSGGTAPSTDASSSGAWGGGDDMSTLSGSTNALQQFLLALTRGAASTPGQPFPGFIKIGDAPTDEDKRKIATNGSYNRALFGDLLTRKDAGGKTITSKWVRDEIKAGRLPALPKSKANGSIPMCLAWHSKGMCNPNTCPSKDDHVDYTPAEYTNADPTKGLKTWCDANYPRSA